MKREADAQLESKSAKSILKKRAKKIRSEKEVKSCFHPCLFAKDTLDRYAKEYASAKPYKHGVIRCLMNDTLLRSVRDEIKVNVHFTPKETDIYKIRQSGDLANLDGLDDSALEKLPSLLRLRDALYSDTFRKYVTAITGSGELSGRKTDMAINVYTPSCHLLCHDDVIGSRRVSYILYLTDPDVPWKEEWGGALRLFPTKTIYEDGETTITPCPDVVKTLPPVWNQLSFFAVQPGESFHDVEEIYRAKSKKQLEKDGGRIRMAISGWYHIPQIGEEGYTEGEEERWGENSSLKQLQGNPDRYDFPQSRPILVEVTTESDEDRELTEADLDFLLKFMAPTYLTPDTLEEIGERFVEISTLSLDGLLSNKFSTQVRKYIEAQEQAPLPERSADIENGVWNVARPPHKHRYLYTQAAVPLSHEGDVGDQNPIKKLLEVFLPSESFRKWLELATHCKIKSYDFLARRFRRGLDYALAKIHHGEPQLEISLGLTPTPGWVTDEDKSDDEDNDEVLEEKAAEKPRMKTMKVNHEEKVTDGEDDVGGHEVYMAGDEDDVDDAAIYKASAEEVDENVLFTMPASWNKMSIVLRDDGVLKFTKYVSKNALGDRWDISGVFDVKMEEEGDIDVDEGKMASSTSSDEEEVFNGFPDSESSESN